MSKANDMIREIIFFKFNQSEDEMKEQNLKQVNLLGG